jgi:putative effector of murein hydrolase
MNTFINILIVFALVILGINIYQINFSDFTNSSNNVAFIGIIASICAVLILLILKNSKKVVEKLNHK